MNVLRVVGSIIYEYMMLPPYSPETPTEPTPASPRTPVKDLRTVNDTSIADLYEKLNELEFNQRYEAWARSRG